MAKRSVGVVLHGGDCSVLLQGSLAKFAGNSCAVEPEAVVACVSHWSLWDWLVRDAAVAVAGGVSALFDCG